MPIAAHVVLLEEVRRVVQTGVIFVPDYISSYADLFVLFCVHMQHPRMYLRGRPLA